MPSELRTTVADDLKKHFPTLSHREAFKTPCTSAVLGMFGIEKNSFKYCQFIEDMQRIFRRNGWKAIKQRIPEKTSWENLNDFLESGFYLVAIDRHVFLIYISLEGEISVPVDTHCGLKFEIPTVESAHRIFNKRNFN